MRAVHPVGTRPAHISIWSLVVCALLLAAPGNAASTAANASPPPAKGTARPCKPTAKKQWISVRLVPPDETIVSAVNLRVDYPNAKLNIPRKDHEEKVSARIGRLPANAVTAINDLGTAVRVVMGKAPKLPTGELFTVEFDRCEGAARATDEDFTCTVEMAANSSGPVAGAGCAVVVP